MRRLSIVVALVSMLQVGPAAGNSRLRRSRRARLHHAGDGRPGGRHRARQEGRPLVTDLGRKDFDVFEDGVRQEVGSFSVVNRGGGIGIGVKFRQPGGTTILNPTDPAWPVHSRAAAEEAMTALVFDALTPESLAATQNAAMAFVPMVGESDSKVAVFATEPALKTTQVYTSDLALIRKGIRDVTATGTPPRSSSRSRRTASVSSSPRSTARPTA